MKHLESTEAVLKEVSLLKPVCLRKPQTDWRKR